MFSAHPITILNEKLAREKCEMPQTTPGTDHRENEEKRQANCSASYSTRQPTPAFHLHCNPPSFRGPCANIPDTIPSAEPVYKAPHLVFICGHLRHLRLKSLSLALRVFSVLSVASVVTSSAFAFFVSSCLRGEKLLIVRGSMISACAAPVNRRGIALLICESLPHRAGGPTAPAHQV
jgi:hypothetical protein